jgi:PQQ-dependent dehydrogenase (methanol/ethanol family)
VRTRTCWAFVNAGIPALVLLGLTTRSLPCEAAAAAPANGEWAMPAHDYASTRYSDLAEITADNVSNLTVQYTFSMGVSRGQEGAPLVMNNTMYLVAPYPNELFALDLTQPGAPLKWIYKPQPLAAAQGVACCDVVNRGAFFYEGAIYYATLDGNAVAVDAQSGKEKWKVRLGDINKGETITMSPEVVKGKVLLGNSGGEYGVRGWLAALDAKTGAIAWKAFSTGPDSEVLIGPQFQPFYNSDKGADLGVRSWPPQMWKSGGGTVWGWISYDPQLNLIYYGTGNPGPWNSDQRPGDNKWTGGIFARDVDTGQARWFYQTVPHDLYDYDAINELVLLDLEWAGKQRKVLVRPERNGYMYVLDRATGEVLAADAYGTINSSLGVDLKTGALRYNPQKQPQLGKVVRDICPTAPGAKDWNPSAYSPRTGLLYVPHMNLCMDWQSAQTNYIAGTPFIGAEVKMYAGPGGNRGVFTAWDVKKRAKAWEQKEDLPLWSGALATAGDLVFYGTLDGWFKALDARTGALHWQFKTGSGIIGQPITYRGPDGHQYIAILSGVGGWAGAIVSGGLDSRDPTAAKGMVNATSDLPQKTTKGGMLYVFALPKH